RWVLAPLRNRSFYSRAELNEAIACQVGKLNARAFRGEPTSRAELFAELERPFLAPLPAGRYEFARWRKAKVHIDYHVDAGDGRCSSRWLPSRGPVLVKVFQLGQASSSAWLRRWRIVSA
ncbi:MAG: hypothetical protein M3063_07095, partial [Actinomycetota bacterium]|nr:hypothetical protein [Actinomycetota bacterium]